MNKEQAKAAAAKYREKTRGKATQTHNQGIAPLQQQKEHTFVERLKPSLAAAYCEQSPSRAHHRDCELVNVPGLDHQHERQMCKYCQNIIWTPCWLCQERTEEKKGRVGIRIRKAS